MSPPIKPTADPTGKPAGHPTEPSTPPGGEEQAPGTRKPASLPQVASAVFWSFFGVRKGRHMLQDMESIKPLHVVIVGVLAGALFVLILLIVVRLIIRFAGPAG